MIENQRISETYFNGYDKEIQNVLSALPDRYKQIICERYGLFCNMSIPKTLEGIGTKHTPPITRERVRQLVNKSLKILTKNKEQTSAMKKLIYDLETLIEKNGGVLPFEYIPEGSSGKENHYKNIITFLCDCSDTIAKEREVDTVRSYYYVVSKKNNVRILMQKGKEVASKLRKNIVYEEDEILTLLKNVLDGQSKIDTTDRTLKNIIFLCKDIKKNTNGEYGHKKTPFVRLKGVSDFLCFALRNEPKHFTDLTQEISRMMEREVSPEYCLNTLVMNKKLFKRCGRGTYKLNIE